MSSFRPLIFGGTTEGRLLAEFCAANGIPCGVSVVSEYGASLLPDGITVHTGRLDSFQMRELLTSCGYTLAVDAAHPYAVEARESIRTACDAEKLPYLRLLRESSEVRGMTAESIERLVEMLNSRDEVILCTLGSKALPALTAVKDYRERIWARVLPSEGIKEYCGSLGFDESKVICAKGPFSVGQNIADLERSGAGILITKESGKAGGYLEKAAAAERCGAVMITLTRPREHGLDLNEAEAELLRRRSRFE